MAYSNPYIVSRQGQLVSAQGNYQKTSSYSGKTRVSNQSNDLNCQAQVPGRNMFFNVFLTGSFQEKAAPKRLL